MRIKTRIHEHLLFFLVFRRACDGQHHSQRRNASCEPDPFCVAVDFPVLCPEQLPNATQGEPYSATATFNLPPSVIDPGSGLEATLLTVTISQVTGLPFGLEFSPSNPDGVYQPGNGEYYDVLWCAEHRW